MTDTELSHDLECLAEFERLGSQDKGKWTRDEWDSYAMRHRALEGRAFARFPALVREVQRLRQEVTAWKSRGRKMSKPRYYLWTWDSDKQDWTPQQGVRCGPWSKWGLRRALRKLRGMGYNARKMDPFILVKRIDP